MIVSCARWLRMKRKDVIRRQAEMSAAAVALGVPTAWSDYLVGAVAAKGPLAPEQAARVRRAFITPV